MFYLISYLLHMFYCMQYFSKKYWWFEKCTSEISSNWKVNSKNYNAQQNSPFVATILVRYCEIGLKSSPVRKKFENQLRDNMLSMFVSDGVETLISYGDARFYLETDDEEKCIKSLKKVFGIASVSSTIVCTSDMEDICKTMAKFSKGKMKKGDSFAVKARREGSQPYTSVDVGREAGSAIFIENKELNVKVDLTNPEHIFYVEIRDNKAYVFDKYISCPGGLPMYTQGRIIADVETERDVVSAWLMMKRGCHVLVSSSKEKTILNEYDPALKILNEEDKKKTIKDVLGKVKGSTIKDIQLDEYKNYNVPLFYPTIGMEDSEVSELHRRIVDLEFD